MLCRQLPSYIGSAAGNAGNHTGQKQKDTQGIVQRTHVRCQKPQHPTPVATSTADGYILYSPFQILMCITSKQQIQAVFLPSSLLQMITPERPHVLQLYYLMGKEKTSFASICPNSSQGHQLRFLSEQFWPRASACSFKLNRKPKQTPQGLCLTRSRLSQSVNQSVSQPVSHTHSLIHSLTHLLLSQSSTYHLNISSMKNAFALVCFNSPLIVFLRLDPWPNDGLRKLTVRQETFH